MDSVRIPVLNPVRIDDSGSDSELSFSRVLRPQRERGNRMMHHAVLGCCTKHMQWPPPSLFPFPPQPRMPCLCQAVQVKTSMFFQFLCELPTRAPTHGHFSPVFASGVNPRCKKSKFASTAEARVLPRGVKRAISRRSQDRFLRQKNFLDRFFGRGISGEALLPLQLCSH